MLESQGCGKSVTATSIMRLVSPSVCEIDENSQILFEGEDLSKASETRMRKVRGNEISMIFQEPMSSLNPVYRIGDQMLEMIRTHHREIPKKGSIKQCIEMLSRVGSSFSGAADQGISTSDVRWYETEGNDRNGIALPAKAFDRR